jgi:cobalt/nickel transport system permease protein
MGVLGAFVFAAQMINFTIPGTGSSGHIGGGLLLSVLLGPHAAFLTIASVLTVQAFFFADGGLLALGTNIFNLGVFPCFVGLPLFRAVAGRAPSATRTTVAAVGAAVAGLEIGAMGVVIETLLSGRSELTPGPFAALMGGIHLPIGIVEGFLTAAVVGYLVKARPELATQAFGTLPRGPGRPRSLAPLLVAVGVAALVTGGLLARFASTRPDGLEWSIARLTGGAQPAPTDRGLPGRLARLQEKTAVFPDYGLPPGRGGANTAGADEPARRPAGAAAPLSGAVGAVLTLALAALVGLVFARCRHTPQP